MRPTGQRGIVDLKEDPRYVLTLPSLGRKGQWSIECVAEKTDKGTRCSMEIGHKESTLLLDQEIMMEVAANILQVLFLSADIPNAAIPEQFRGNLQVSHLWAQAQAQNFLGFMIQTLTGMLETDNGGKWKVDWGYEPNISSSNLVTLAGEKPQTWDGSFRPVMRLMEVIMPRFTGEAHDPQGRNDADSQLVGADTP